MWFPNGGEHEHSEPYLSAHFQVQWPQSPMTSLIWNPGKPSQFLPSVSSSCHCHSCHSLTFFPLLPWTPPSPGFSSTFLAVLSQSPSPAPSSPSSTCNFVDFFFLKTYLGQQPLCFSFPVTGATWKCSSAWGNITRTLPLAEAASPSGRWVMSYPPRFVLFLIYIYIRGDFSMDLEIVIF